MQSSLLGYLYGLQKEEVGAKTYKRKCDVIGNIGNIQKSHWALGGNLKES